MSLTIIGKNMNQNKERRERDLEKKDMRERSCKAKTETTSDLLTMGSTMDMTSLPQVPTTQKAVIQSKASPTGFEVAIRQVPVPLANQILVKVLAVALNQCDWKMPLRVPRPGAVDGGDYSGIVVRVGKDVTGWKVGDRAAGAQVGSDVGRPGAGSFTEYVAEDADQGWYVPDHLTWEEGAAVGCAVTTSVGMALWRSLKLPGTPEEPTLTPKYVLVCGGASASGTFAIQVLKLSGYKVITTCSAKNFELVKTYGAEKAFDYHSPTCGEDIRAYTSNALEYVLDIITEAKTIRQSYAAIGRGGGRYCGFELLPEELIASMRKAVKSDWVMGIEMTGVEVKLPGEYHRDANAELRAWGCAWIRRFEALFAAKKIRPHPVKKTVGGLEKVIDGIGTMQRKEVSGQKLVYTLRTSE